VQSKLAIEKWEIKQKVTKWESPASLDEKQLQLYQILCKTVDPSDAANTEDIFRLNPHKDIENKIELAESKLNVMLLSKLEYHTGKPSHRFCLETIRNVFADLIPYKEMKHLKFH